MPNHGSSRAHTNRLQGIHHIHYTKSLIFITMKYRFNDEFRVCISGHRVALYLTLFTQHYKNLFRMELQSYSLLCQILVCSIYSRNGLHTKQNTDCTVFIRVHKPTFHQRSHNKQQLSCKYQRTTSNETDEVCQTLNMINMCFTIIHY